MKINFYQIYELIFEFFSELKNKKHHFSNVSFFNLFIYFSKGTKKLLSFNPSIISVELTSTKSMLFFAIINKQNIYFEIFFDEITSKYITTSVNIYKNKSQILAIEGNFEEILNNIKTHINN